MAGFDSDIIEEVKRRNEITETISQYIQVRAVGSTLKALCPFHNEKTPSFIINRERQIYKCFGCGEGGDVIQFVMKMENLDFMEAVQLLAQRSNLSLEDFHTAHAAKTSPKKDLYYEIHKKAARFYFDRLTKQANPALEYLLKRGISQTMIKSFGLGYATGGWAELVHFLKNSGYSAEDMLKCGLILENKEKTDYYDRFRNRIMFPIFDVRGNVVAFGGRVLDQGQPKYLNSPETPIFTKSNTIYGLNFARKHLQNQRLILVEGYMDVLALHQHGIKNAVAALGTAFTKLHGQILKRYCQEVIVCFDGDSAGQKAALRSIELLQEADLSCKLVQLPDQLDPDDYIRRQGKFQFLEQIEKAISPIEYKINLERKKFNIEQPEGKIQFVKALGSILRQVKSPVEKEVFIQRIEKEIGISKMILEEEIYGKPQGAAIQKNPQYTSRNKRDNKYIDVVPLAEQKGHLIAEQQLIKGMLTHEGIRARLLSKIEPQDFSTEKHQDLVAWIQDRTRQGQPVDMSVAMQTFQQAVYDIVETEIDHIDMEAAIEEYIEQLKRFKQLYQLKLLQDRQNALLQDKKLNKEEVEKELLNIGLEMMKIHTALQKRSLKEGRRLNE